MIVGLLPLAAFADELPGEGATLEEGFQGSVTDSFEQGQLESEVDSLGFGLGEDTSDEQDESELQDCGTRADDADASADEEAVDTAMSENDFAKDGDRESEEDLVLDVASTDDEIVDEDATYTVAFNANGGSGAMTEVVAYVDERLDLPICEFSRDGYEFVGWNTKANGTGTSYDDCDFISYDNVLVAVGGTITLYAQWETIEYSISYQLYGGTNNSQNPKAYRVTTATITLASPTRKGYTFGGWYSDAKLTKRVRTIAKGSTGNKTLYAKWTANKYTIVYNGNGATSGSMSKQTGRTYGKTYKLKANAFKRSGKFFVGWNTKKNGSGTWYNNKASVKNLTAKKNGTVTLYAQWEGYVGVTTGSTDYGAVAIIRNHYSKNLRITATFLYYRGSTLVANRSEYNYCLQGGTQCALQGWIYNVDYTSCKVQVSYEDASSNIISNVSGISTQANFGDGNVQVAVRNNGVSVSFTQVAIVFYRNGRIVGYDYQYADVDYRGATDHLEFRFPHNTEYDTIVPTSYRVFVNNSYGYSWG